MNARSAGERLARTKGLLPASSPVPYRAFFLKAIRRIIEDAYNPTYPASSIFIAGY